jgi:GlcNAc-P-P-Und epimerase
MKIVVTGSSGYIGAAMTHLLVEQCGHHVVGIDRIEPSVPPSQRFEFIRWDLASPDEAPDAALFDAVDAVIHLAAARGDWAISDDEYWRDNREATETLLDTPWAQRIPFWVFMSSVSVYGPAESPLTEQATCAPSGAYGESKLASELLFKKFAVQYGRDGCVIRPSAVFGPGHPNNTNVHKLIESLRRWPLPLVGGGGNRKTLTYLPNLLDLVVWALDRMRTGQLKLETYNYVEEPVLTVAELIATLKQVGISRSQHFRVPIGLALAASYPVYALAKLIDVDLRITPERVRKFTASTWYDSSRVRLDGFSPRVGLTDALRRTVLWHLSCAQCTGPHI